MSDAPPAESGTRVEVPLTADEKAGLRRRANEEGRIGMGAHLRRLLIRDLESHPPTEADALRRASASEIKEQVR